MSQVKMLQCTVVARQQDADDLLEALQDEALVHVAETEVPEELAEALRATGGGAPRLDDERPPGQDVLEACQRLERQVQALASVSPAPARRQDTTSSIDEVKALVDDLIVRRDAARDAIDEFQRQIDLLAPWGDFDPADLALFEEHGVVTTFARFSRPEWDAFRSPVPWAVVSSDERWVRVVFFHRRGEEAAPEVPAVDLPTERLDVLRQQREAAEAEIRRVNRELGRFAHFRPLMEERVRALQDRVEVVRARKQGFEHASLFALTGFVPETEAMHLQQVLGGFDVAFQLGTVSAGDRRVPVKLKNNALVRGFEAVVKAFSGVAYHEKDYTWAVAVLFMTFGSLCLLDGGYGLLLAGLGAVLMRTGADAFGRVFLLTGIASVALGLFVGQFFGLVVGTHVLEGYRPLLTLAEKPYDCFVFSLVVGMVAIGFAYSVAIWQRGPRTQATGSLVLVLAATTAVFANLAGEYVLTVLNAWHPPSEHVLGLVHTWGNRVALLLGVIALVLYVLFPDEVFGKQARAGNVLWTLYSGPTGLLQDLLSHMRLFGIALSGSIMALVVNDIGSRFPLPVTVLFAVVGHVFVFVLALLSLYIHTNRLIFLEFGSKCIDGGHNLFSPLRRSASVRGSS